VILESHSGTFIERVGDFQKYFERVAVSVDLFPYLREEFERMKREVNSPPVRCALEGVRLWARSQ